MHPGTEVHPDLVRQIPPAVERVAQHDESGKPQAQDPEGREYRHRPGLEPEAARPPQPLEGLGPGRFKWENRPTGRGPEKRFAAVVHLLSVRNNRRVRLRCFAADHDLPVVPSLVGLYPVANWFEREAFDLYGIVFEGHPDLRRILTDYGFVGHPFRKDFPMIGNVEVLYDAERKRVVYQPVSIEPRVNVPRVVREDSRWQQAAAEQPQQVKK